MAYMRGDFYLWSDSDRLHVWVADGYDGWDESSWARDEHNARHADRVDASGVSLPVKVMDEFVLMRVAELIQNGAIEGTIERFLGPDGHGGNFGAETLEKNAGMLKVELGQIKRELRAGQASNEGVVTNSDIDQAQQIVAYYQGHAKDSESSNWDLGLYMAQRWLSYLKSPRHDVDDLKLFHNALKSQQENQGSGWRDLLIRARNLIAKLELTQE